VRGSGGSRAGAKALGQQHIGRLQVAMNHPQGMHRRNPLGQLAGQSRDFGNRQWPCGEPILQ